jgi:hypothetical protein
MIRLLMVTKSAPFKATVLGLSKLAKNEILLPLPLIVMVFVADVPGTPVAEITPVVTLVCLPPNENWSVYGPFKTSRTTGPLIPQFSAEAAAAKLKKFVALAGIVLSIV